MDLAAVADEIRAALGAISGLRRPPWGVETVTPPAALVTLPMSVDYDTTYARGADRYPDLPVVVLAGKPADRSTRKRLADYAAGAGPKSVKAALEAHPWQTCDSVRVTSADFDVVTFASTTYACAVFHLDVIGKGI